MFPSPGAQRFTSDMSPVTSMIRAFSSLFGAGHRSGERVRGLALFVAIILGCTRAEPRSSSQAAEETAVALDPATRTVLPTNIQAGPLGCNRASPRGTIVRWEPPPELVRSIDERLGALLDSVINRLDTAATSPGLRSYDYYRQYAGVELNGAKLVYVNGFHRDILRKSAKDPTDTIQWRTYPLSLCDRGATAFGILFVVDGQRFTRLEFANRFDGPVRY
jgi:hypothetical protein